MHPYFHLGPITLAAYGIVLAVSFVASLFVLRHDLRSRGFSVNPYVVVGITGLAGLSGAKLWHCLEAPKLFLRNPLSILRPGGFAFFGALLFGAVVLLIIARHYRLSPLLMMDLASPVAALGYAFGRLGCLLSGDGDYGIPTRLPWGMAFPNGLIPTVQRVHPTPLYEAIAAALIFVYLWKLRREALSGRIPMGTIFATYLALSGTARFLVEFIRINPRVFWGMSNAQIASLASVAIGSLLLWRCFSHRSGKATIRVPTP